LPDLPSWRSSISRGSPTTIGCEGRIG